MKVVAFNGSARRDGNTAILIRHVFCELEKEGIETELVQLSGQTIHGCLACRECSARKDRRCAQKNDFGNQCIDKMAAADGIILGSPTYVTDVSPEIKALIDRACLVSKANGGMFRYKTGAAVVAVRRAGAIHAFDTLNHFFQISEMIVPGSSLLEHRDRPRKRRGGERRRGHRHHAHSRPQHGLADAKNLSLTGGFRALLILREGR